MANAITAICSALIVLMLIAAGLVIFLAPEHGATHPPAPTATPVPSVFVKGGVTASQSETEDSVSFSTIDKNSASDYAVNQCISKGMIPAVESEADIVIYTKNEDGGEGASFYKKPVCVIIKDRRTSVILYYTRIDGLQNYIWFYLVLPGRMDGILKAEQKIKKSHLFLP